MSPDILSSGKTLSGRPQDMDKAAGHRVPRPGIDHLGADIQGTGIDSGIGHLRAGIQGTGIHIPVAATSRLTLTRQCCDRSQ